MKINNMESIYGGFRIYGAGKVLWSSNRSYIEQSTIGDSGTSTKYNSRLTSLTLAKNPVKALKLNLNRQDNFYIYEDLEYSYPKRQLVLYIHESEIEVRNLGEVVRLKQAHQTDYIEAYNLTALNGHFSYTETTYVKIPDDYVFADSRERSSYFRGQDGVGRIAKYTPTDITSMIITGDYITRTEYDDHASKARILSDTFKESYGINLDAWQVEKILEDYSIVKK